jgi:hypothetical protein
MRKNDVDINYEYYSKNVKELKKKYSNQYVVIYEEKVVFNSKDMQKTLEYAKQLDAGSYIIQKIEMDEGRSIQTFHTRVSF